MAADTQAQATTDAGTTVDDKATDKGASDQKSTTDTKATDDAGKKTDAATDAGTSDDKTKGTDGDKPKAPESYTLTVPDEAKRFVTDKDLALMHSIAKANDWTNEEAQAELNERVGLAKANLEARVATLAAEVKADPTWGGANFAQTQKHADRAIDHVMPEGHPLRDRFLRELKESGGDVSLPFVAFLAILGSQVSEDAPGRSRSAAAHSSGGEKKFYNHPTSIALDEASKGS